MHHPRDSKKAQRPRKRAPISTIEFYECGQQEREGEGFKVVDVGAGRLFKRVVGDGVVVFAFGIVVVDMIIAGGGGFSLRLIGSGSEGF